MKRTTLKDIAKALNTTIATVSRALHDSEEISAEMKNRVREVANLYNYKPNNTALSLKYQKSYTFGVIFPTLGQYHMSQILSGLLQESTQKGYKLIIAESNYEPDKEIKFIQEFYELNVDGIFILPSRKLNMKKDLLEEIIRDDVPFLVIDRKVYFDRIKIPFISSDDYVGTQEGITHLIEQGYKKIAHLKGLESSSVSNIRHKAYLDTLKKNKMEHNTEWVMSCKKFTIDEGRQLAKELINLEDKPDAIFCINDRIAVGVLDGIKKAGLNVPQDIGVLGFSNSLISEACSPTLSTIHQPGMEIGKKSIRLVLSNMDNNKDISRKNIVLKTSLVKRESTSRIVQSS